MSREAPLAAGRPSEAVEPSVEVASFPADRLLPALLFATLAVLNGSALLRTGRPEGGAGETALSLALSPAAAHSLLTCLFYALVAGLFLLRRDPGSSRAGPGDLTLAGLGTFMMGAVAGQPATVHDWRLLALADGALTIGLAFSTYAAASLGRCFGLAPEVRGLVTSGAYRLVRHPLYLGEAVAGLGLVLPVLSPLTGGVFALFLACQVARSRREERALANAFPAYAAYRVRVPAYLPRVSVRGTRTPCTARPRWRRSAVR